MIGQKKIIKIRLIAIFGLYFWSTQLLHAQTYTLRTSGFSNGAGNVQSTTYKLNATVGQDIVGRVSSANYQLLTGYVPSSSGVVPQLPDLDLQQPNINPVSVAPGKTTAATFILKNIGDGDVTVPLVVKAYLSVNSTWDAGDTELASFVLGNSLAKGAQISFPQTGQSNLITIPSATALGSYQIILVADPALTIEEKNETNNIRSLALTVAIGSSSDDTTPPSFGSITKPARFGAGQQVSLSNVTDPSGIKEVLLVYRPILANTFAAPVATTASGSTYSVSLTASWADQLGIEFYFRATDNANNSAETQRQFLYMPSDENLVIPNLAAGGTLADYRIFSIPYKLDKASIADVFGPTFGGGDKTKWRIVRYQNGRNVDYPEVITSIEPGKGYWFNAKEKSDVKIGAGSVVEANQGSSVFQMRLEQGWNQIGNPFPFNIDWSDVMQSNTTAAGKADNIVTVYDPSSTSFKEADNLKVWEGGFVFANEPLTLDLPVTLKNTAGGRKATRQLNSSIDQRDWFVSLTLRQGVAENSYGGIGMHPEARESKDPFDKQTLPRFIKYLELNSYHPEFFSPWFSKDVVPTKESHTWQLEVASNFDEKEIELSWNAPALGNNASKLLLFDPQAGVLLDMKEQSAYRFENTGVRKLKVYYGKDEASLRPDITILGQPYPNPFVGSVNLPFIMGEAGAVQISIFDLLGKKIKDVANNPYNPGLHTVQWDGTDQTGARVAAGVYFYRMMTNGLSPAATGRLIVR